MGTLILASWDSQQRTPLTYIMPMMPKLGLCVSVLNWISKTEFEMKEKRVAWDFPNGPVLWLCTPNAGGPSSIPGQRSRPCMLQWRWKIPRAATETVCVCVCLVTQSCPTLCDLTACSPPDSPVHADSPGKNTRGSCHALLQGIFPTQESNPGLLHYRQILYHLSHQGSTSILEWGAHSFSRGSSWPKNSIFQCHIADKTQVCAWSEVAVFLILIRFSRPFNLALGGFLAASPLISNSWNPLFGIQGRSWRPESCLQETGDPPQKKGLYAQEPTWYSPTPTVSPRLLTHGNYEIINGCCFSS